MVLTVTILGESQGNDSREFFGLFLLPVLVSLQLFRKKIFKNVKKWPTNVERFP